MKIFWSSNEKWVLFYVSQIIFSKILVIKKGRKEQSPFLIIKTLPNMI